LETDITLIEEESSKEDLNKAPSNKSLIKPLKSLESNLKAKRKKISLLKSSELNLNYNLDDKLDRFLIENQSNLNKIIDMASFIPDSSKNFKFDTEKLLSASDCEKQEKELLKFKEYKALNVLLNGSSFSKSQKLSSSIINQNYLKCNNDSKSNNNSSNNKIDNSKISNLDGNSGIKLYADNINKNFNYRSNYNSNKYLKKSTNLSESSKKNNLRLSNLSNNNNFSRINDLKSPTNIQKSFLLQSSECKTTNLKNLILQETFSKINQNFPGHNNNLVDIKEVSLEEPLCSLFLQNQKEIVKNVKMFRESIKKHHGFNSVKKLQK